MVFGVLRFYERHRHNTEANLCSAWRQETYSPDFLLLELRPHNKLTHRRPGGVLNCCASNRDIQVMGNLLKVPELPTLSVHHAQHFSARTVERTACFPCEIGRN
jgi:hypothetical protein